MSKKVLFTWFIVYCMFSAPVFGQDQYSLGGFDSPVCVTQYGGFLYLSNSGNHFGLSVEDGDGYISRVRSDGSQQDPTMKFITGLNNPRGIYVIQGTLYVCDINRLVGFDVRPLAPSPPRKIVDISFANENVTQLTGIASFSDNLVYLTATDINAIFEVNLSTGQYQKWMEISAPSGILIDNNQMYISSMGTDSLPNGKLGVIDMRTKQYTQLIDDEGYFFGLALNDKRLYYSDWVQFAKRGIIKWVDLDTKSTGQLRLTQRIGGPADFHFDSRNDLFIIPAVLEGSVYGCLNFTR